MVYEPILSWKPPFGIMITAISIGRFTHKAKPYDLVAESICVGRIVQATVGLLAKTEPPSWPPVCELHGHRHLDPPQAGSR